MGLETLPPHEFEDSPDFSEDIFGDEQEQIVTIVPNLAISEIITMRIIDLKICLGTGIDNNAAPPKVEIARCENGKDHNEHKQYGDRKNTKIYHRFLKHCGHCSSVNQVAQSPLEKGQCGHHHLSAHPRTLLGTGSYLWGWYHTVQHNSNTNSGSAHPYDQNERRAPPCTKRHPVQGQPHHRLSGTASGHR